MRDGEKIECLPKRIRIFLNAILQILTMYPLGFITEYVRMNGEIAGYEVDAGDIYSTDRGFPTITVDKKQMGSLRDFHRTLTGITQLYLVLTTIEVI